jgi:hypothetical protein
MENQGAPHLALPAPLGTRRTGRALAWSTVDLRIVVIRVVSHHSLG